MIDVLMSTYNGAKFIEAQIDSILTQDFQDLRLIVRDDGSTDGTPDILEHYRLSDPRVEIVRDGIGNIGSARSFLSLLEISAADFFMFADQDDIWLQGKISSSLRKIEELSSTYTRSVPTLIFTDLIVCDENMNAMSNSLWRHQRLDPKICRDWRRLLAQNVVTGSTIIGNAAARRASLPFVLKEMFHDHWVAVNVARVGVVDYQTTATILYRQHSGNVEGAKNFNFRYAFRRLMRPRKRYEFYRRAGDFFGISSNRLLFTKIVESFRRIIRR